MGTAPAGALFRPRAPRPRPVRSWGQSSQPPPTAVQPEPDAAGRHRAGSTVPAVWGHPAMAARLARAEPGTDERSSMRTRLTIMAIVLAAAAGAIGIIVGLVILLGWLGLAIGALGSMTVLGVYRRWIQPWQHRWGATDEEVHRAMPGDDLIPTPPPPPGRSVSRPQPRTSGRGWCSSATAGVAGTATTGSTTTASPAPTTSSPNCNSSRL